MWTCYICVTMIKYVLYVDLFYMCDYDHARVICGPVIHICVTMIMHELKVDLLYMCEYDHACVICGPVVYV